MSAPDESDVEPRVAIDHHEVEMQMVGHRTESVYRRYHIVAEADIHDACARLDAVAHAKASTTKGLRFKKQPKTVVQTHAQVAPCTARDR